MASFMCSASTGGKGSGGSRAEYIAREGKYQGYERYEDLVAEGSGNMPAWAAENPVDFWKAADEGERKGGLVFRELKLALPRELTLKQNQRLLQDFAKRRFGEKFAYQWAMHDKKAAIDGGDQLHAHLMHSLRERDGIERDPEQYFKRYNAKKPEQGGCKKSTGGVHLSQLQIELIEERKLWADVQNEHLAKHGHSARVDHRSYKDQGIDRTPEPHLGPRFVEKMTQKEKDAFLERRHSEEARVREQRELEASVIELSADLETAQRELEAVTVDLPADIAEARQILVDQKAEDFAKRAEQRLAEKAEAAKAVQREKEAAQKAEIQKANEPIEKWRKLMNEQAAKVAQVEKHQVKRPAPTKTKGNDLDMPGM